MTHLIALLTSGEGTWMHIASLIKTKQFEKTVIVTNEYGLTNFPQKFPDLNTEDTRYDFVVVNFNKPVKFLIDDIVAQLKQKTNCFEAAVNFVSGTGKEHMALIASLIKLGIAFRLVAMTKDGLYEL